MRTRRQERILPLLLSSIRPAVVGSLILSPGGGVVGCSLEPRIDTLEQDVSALRVGLDATVQAVGSIQVGGGGDSVTAWLYAAIAGAALLYPMVWRPLRRRLNGKG